MTLPYGEYRKTDKSFLRHRCPEGDRDVCFTSKTNMNIAFIQLIKNWFMLSVYRVKDVREVWRARKKRKSCSRR